MRYKVFIRPSCRDCHQAIRLLNEAKVEYAMHSTERQCTYVLHMQKKYNLIPIPFILQIDSSDNERLIGGCAELYKHLNKMEKKNV
tara:strand:+ start:493 stop:750 length:258 start_codon:yes stop_codon:yes gene_type:complete